jgi:hypothetical protein
MLNPEFTDATVTTAIDPNTVYKCSPWIKASGWTPLMALVMSGRDPEQPDRLARQVELEVFLATPESVEAAAQTNSRGWTALMLAARNSRTDSTERVVELLLAHASSSKVGLLQNTDEFTALELAACNSGGDSTERAVQMLLDHDTGRILVQASSRALHMAAVFVGGTPAFESLGWHEHVLELRFDQNAAGQPMPMSPSDWMPQWRNLPPMCSTHTTVSMLAALAIEADVAHLSKISPAAFQPYFLDLHRRMSERACLSHALSQGLSLPEAITLLYV